MRSKAQEKRADHGRNLAFQGSNRWVGIPTLLRLGSSHTCELFRPSAFTVTGIARVLHPYSPKRSFLKIARAASGATINANCLSVHGTSKRSVSGVLCIKDSNCLWLLLCQVG